MTRWGFRRLGLRLRANLPIVGGMEVTTRPAGVLSGLSLSPTGKNFGTNYQMSFYAWSNYFGAANGSGLADTNGSEGGTANALFAVGTSGTVPLVVGQPGLASGAAMDGIGFATTTDGAVALDYRVYPKSGTVSPAGTGIYAAEGTVDPGNLSPLASNHAFYPPLFPSLSAPAVQLELSTAEFADASNTQLGMTPAGTFGFALASPIAYGSQHRWPSTGTPGAATAPRIRLRRRESSHRNPVPSSSYRR